MGEHRMTAVAGRSTPNEDAATGNNSGYRLDLDGLRGIAIFLVAVFHVWFGKVSGGVDVFLTEVEPYRWLSPTGG